MELVLVLGLVVQAVIVGFVVVGYLQDVVDKPTHVEEEDDSKKPA